MSTMDRLSRSATEPDSMSPPASAIEATSATPNSVGASVMTHVVHVTSSRFFGGPERQMLELAHELRPAIRSSFISFSEGQLCRPFIDRVTKAGFCGIALNADTPNLISAARELRSHLQDMGADVLLVHGYKAGLMGLWTARRLGIPIVAVSRGWTGESPRVRVYEWLDRRSLRWMDRVVCVSEGQAAKVRAAGVKNERIVVIRNAIRTNRFHRPPCSADRNLLAARFSTPPTLIAGAAGRLSPEKGFDVLVEACRHLAATHRDFALGVVIFGEGALRRELERQIKAADLTDRVVLAGFTDELDRWMPHFDIYVQSSHSEGLSNSLLEAAAAGVPIVATDVGGTAEFVSHEHTGLLVPPNDAPALASAIGRLAVDPSLRRSLGAQANATVARSFTFGVQACAYQQVLRLLIQS